MATKQTMSVTRALATLSSIGDQIAELPLKSTWIAVQIGTGAKAKESTGNTVADVTANIQSSFDTMKTLFTKRAALKSAVVLSNANTKVKVGGREMTVAEAIELKSGVAARKVLIAQMKQAQLKAQASVETTNKALQAKLDDQILKMLGGDTKSIKDVDATALEALAKPQRETSEASLIDPGKLADTIKKMEGEITELETELDYTLSEINAKTEISVEY